MKPVFAILAGFAVYAFCLFFELILRKGFSDPKALLVLLMVAVGCSSYFMAELRRMMRATETEFEDEKKWVQSVVRPGMSVREASDALRARFEAKEKATGFSMTAGIIQVHDFSSDISEVRLESKHDSITSVRIAVPYAKKA